MKYSGKKYQVTVPKSRDPFVNTQVIRAGIDSDCKRERFWTTSYNANEGGTGVLIDEWGNSDIIRFGKPYAGFYSAIYAGGDNLWLCGFMDEICRYDLSSGDLESFKTGKNRSLVFNGMPYDDKTGRLFVAASSPPDSEGLVFDTREKKVVEYYKNRWEHKYLSNSFPNGDGTFTIVLNVPGTGFYRWDPANGDITHMRSFSPHEVKGINTSGRLLIDNKFFIGKGWYDPLANDLTDGPIPEEHAAWLQYDPVKGCVYGCIGQSSDCTLVRWELQTGKVAPLYTIKNCSPLMVNFTDENIAVAVNLYGYFHRINLEEQCLEAACRLDTDATGLADCIIRVDEKTLLGTPFITQRFWTVDLTTGVGKDCGRVASAGGQVNLTWNIGGKIYMACYTSGELAVYDPSLPVFYPENPYVSVYPPRPAMRPVAGADDGENIYYTCDNAYGLAGCMLVRYNTKSNKSSFVKDVLPGQQIRSMFYDEKEMLLVGGTTPEGDCGSYIPDYYESYFTLIDTTDLTVIKKTKAEEGTKIATVIGLLGDKKALVRQKSGTCIWDYDTGSLKPYDYSNRLQGNIPALVPTCKQGYFVLLHGTSLELWDLASMEKLKLLADDIGPCRIIIDKNDIILYANNEITLLEDALKGL